MDVKVNKVVGLLSDVENATNDDILSEGTQVLIRGNNTYWD
jgi:hypothetical protein